MYKISIIHPSRQRPKQADQTIKNWLGNAVHKSSLEYILSVDKSDPNLKRYKEIGIANGTYVAVNNNKSAIQAINNATKVSTANIIIQIADDFDCFPNWDVELLEELKDKEDFIVKTQDGIQPTLITLPLMDRKYYNRFGYIYHPSYVHMFSDQELTAVGMMLGKVIKSDLMFKHNHYLTGNSKKDIVNVKNDKSWNQGKKNFNERLKTNFGIENSVMEYKDIVWR